MAKEKQPASVIQVFDDRVVIGGVSIPKRASYDQGLEFERRVAAIFRSLGAAVEHNTSLAGNQIDILVSEATKAGTPVRTAIECKALSKPVGVDAINAFSGVAFLLRSRGLIDKASIVSLSGFSQQARNAAEKHGVDLLEVVDLEQQLKGKESEFPEAMRELERAEQAEKESSEPAPKRAFVVMPFAREFNDLYILGIREVAESLGMIVVRADEIQHNESIPEIIRRSIAETDIVIAEISNKNPNVMYEVGLAHATDKETILICDDAKTIPFDLTSINHIAYSGIVELRDKLKTRLEAFLKRNTA